MLTMHMKWGLSLWLLLHVVGFRYNFLQGTIYSTFLREMLLNVDQASLSHFLGCQNSSISELGNIDLPASGPAEVICLKPFRPRASHMIDDVDRNWPRQEGGLTSDILDLFPAERDKEDVPDVSGCDRGFLSWSTPQRTDSPLVYDALFIGRTFLAHPSCSSPGSEPAVT